MKKHIVTAGFVLASLCAGAQSVGISIDNSLPDSSAILDLKSTSKGLLVPRLTAANIAGISKPAPGLLVYRTDSTSGFYYNSGTATSPVWTALRTGSTTLVELAPASQQTATANTALISAKLIGSQTFNYSNTPSLLSLSASGNYDYNGLTALDQQRFNVGVDGSILSIGDYNQGAVPMEGSGTRFMVPWKGCDPGRLYQWNPVG